MDYNLKIYELVTRINEAYDFIFIGVFLLLGLVLISKGVNHLLRMRKSKLSVGLHSMAHGLFFGKKNGLYYFSKSDSEGSGIVLGGSGSGKSTAVLQNTLQLFKGNFFAIDIAGDLERNVKRDHVIFAPEEPERSVPYNIFYEVDALKDEKAVNQGLTELSHIVIPDLQPNASDTSIYFTNGARDILTAGLLSFYHKTTLDWSDFCSFICNSSYQEFFAKIDELAVPEAISLINGFYGNNEKNIAGCYQALVSEIKLFGTNEYVKSCMRRPDPEEKCFTPELLETDSIFFVVSEALLHVYAPLIRIIINQLFGFCSKRENYSKPTLLFALDELPAYGRIDGLLRALRLFRKKGIRLLVCCQSLCDIDLCYGFDERKAMLNNLPFKIVLGADDVETMEYLAKLVGHKMEKAKSVSYGAKGTTTTESSRKEYAIEPEQFSRLGRKMVLIYPGGHKVLKKHFFFQKSFFERLKGVLK